MLQRLRSILNTPIFETGKVEKFVTDFLVGKGISECSVNVTEETQHDISYFRLKLGKKEGPSGEDLYRMVTLALRFIDIECITQRPGFLIRHDAIMSKIATNLSLAQLTNTQGTPTAAAAQPSVFFRTQPSPPPKDLFLSIRESLSKYILEDEKYSTFITISKSKQQPYTQLNAYGTCCYDVELNINSYLSTVFGSNGVTTQHRSIFENLFKEHGGVISENISNPVATITLRSLQCEVCAWIHQQANSPTAAR